MLGFSLQAGASVIVILMYWGKPHKLYPSEHTLSVARHFATLNVSLVLGDFPALSQKHAYFGKTFIVFSPGRLLVYESELCWQKVSPSLQLCCVVPCFDEFYRAVLLLCDQLSPVG